MYLIVGLGNPESDYAKTRHNMGFNVINKLSDKYGIEVNKKKFKSLFGMGEIEGKKVILLKPQTYMNLSGEAVRECMDFYKIKPEELIVIYDDVDTDLGNVRIRIKGSAGTHNGMKSVIQNISTEEFARIRVGIGKPEDGEDMISYVIGAIKEEDKEGLEKGVEKAFEAVVIALKENIDIAMNRLN
ncbi:MAG: aminoacyl-tRNA hydrolase [Clostridia bacterium]|nr:aminoacyl-tRNA hydrolase [Clostridia bacterium]